MHWLLQVEDTNASLETLQKTPKRKAIALTDILEHELARQVANMEQRYLREHRALLQGRQVLFLIHEHCRTNRNLGLVYDITYLNKLTFQADWLLENFRNDWDQVLA